MRQTQSLPDPSISADISDPDRLEQRILLTLPIGRDATLARAALVKAGLEPHVCRDLGDLTSCLEQGAGAAVLAEEALGRRTSELFAVFDRQPSWSMPSIFVLLRNDGPLPRTLISLRAFEKHPKIKATFLQRPVSGLSLISAVRAGLRARLQQYQVRNLLQRLEDDVRRRDEFLAMLGHELRNPVSSIAYVAEMFQLAGPQLAPATAAWGANLMVRQIRHLSRLLDELLDVARIQSGKIELQANRVDLRLIVEQSAETFRHAGAQRNFEQLLPEQPVMVSGDGVRLTQIVNNLLDNAFKYTEPGGSIWLELTERDNMAVLTVTDDGRGISRAALAHVFEPFYQEGARRPASSTGLGLGLAMVENIVRLHKGEIEAHSAGAGQGTRFEVRLPLAAPASSHMAVAETAAMPTQRLLIIEDNSEVADLFALLLESLGHEAHVAYEGEKGVSLAQALKPDMVFIDIGLPDISGQEVARRIRATLSPGAPPLVALTGYPPRNDKEAELFEDYVLKPIGRERIETLFRKVFAAP